MKMNTYSRYHRWKILMHNLTVYLQVVNCYRSIDNDLITIRCTVIIKLIIALTITEGYLNILLTLLLI